MTRQQRVPLPWCQLLNESCQKSILMALWVYTTRLRPAAFRSNQLLVWRKVTFGFARVCRPTESSQLEPELYKTTGRIPIKEIRHAVYHRFKFIPSLLSVQVAAT